MKQHIDVKQWEMLSEEQQERLIPWLIDNVQITSNHYSRYWTIGKSLEFIRHHHQIDVYTGNEIWCVQLFDAKDCVNDEVSCIYEIDRKELIDALYECIVWILERLIDS